MRVSETLKKHRLLHEFHMLIPGPGDIHMHLLKLDFI